jgi:uncharacterized membrane protein
MRAWSLLPLAALGCSYDLEALRNDAALRDRPTAVIDAPAPLDVPPVVDVVDASVARDAGPTRPPRVGMCMQSHYNLNQQRSAQSLPEGAPFLTPVLDTTEGVRDFPIPSTFAPNCGSADIRQPAGAPPVRLFRYEVQRGPRVTVSANTGACMSGDTRIMAWASCDGVMARSMPLGCNDDDNIQLCPTCAMGAADGACSPYQATLTLGNLVRGDVLWFGVHTFQSRTTDPATGPFRLWVGENALRAVPLPADATNVSNRCTCQMATPPVVRSVAWPAASDYGPSNPSTFVLAQDQTGAIGVRDVTGLAGVTGVSARFSITAIVRDPAEECLEDPSAILDLEIGNQTEGWVVASVQLDANSLRAPLTVSFPYTPVSRAMGVAQPVRPMTGGTRYNFQLRMRRSLPEKKCVRLNLDLTAAAQNNVILYGN